ncbi:hypothetical protein SHJG_p1066 (plasmid) [Streptomyces hygroscopicus subsp. jinggangensis 5008]|nr:hypothetical protein SHJG_p1066 [Streptomyces hygroscopicus subsp. jinggangensis 5008]AGF68351.1 hypothetical protein SHJGH_p1066 [Streptomyces hygroscopicus subsp. jinggangensis TL01]
MMMTERAMVARPPVAASSPSSTTFSPPVALEPPSPHARGAHRRRRVRHGGDGTIPARAGSTAGRRNGGGAGQDHPHGRGEHWRRPACSGSKWGPSSRARGAQDVDHHRGPRVGTSPAPAESTAVRRSAATHPQDHPRACGEHLTGTFGLIVGGGPFPPLRGALDRPASGHRAFGTIPAPAGSMPRHVRWRPESRDHPRACGEHLVPVGDPVPGSGPSPRLRGARRLRLGAAVLVGTILAPAGSTVLLGHLHERVGTILAPAGSTRRATWRRPAVRDHPRACGEHRSSKPGPVMRPGPSSRLRGARTARPPPEGRGGTILAPAGSTLTDLHSYRAIGSSSMTFTESGIPTEAHFRDGLPSPPTPCEHAATAAPVRPTASRSASRMWWTGDPRRPPRALGTRPDAADSEGCPGTIPAGARSTWKRDWKVTGPGDHPRGRGEHRLVATSTHWPPGPSPWARGALASPVSRADTLGTIPAGAGSTGDDPGTSWARRDHPRGRGEHFGLPLRQYGNLGPSPRARGAPPAQTRTGASWGDHPRGRGEHFAGSTTK